MPSGYTSHQNHHKPQQQHHIRGFSRPRQEPDVSYRGDTFKKYKYTISRLDLTISSFSGFHRPTRVIPPAPQRPRPPPSVSPRHPRWWLPLIRWSPLRWNYTLVPPPLADCHHSRPLPRKHLLRSPTTRSPKITDRCPSHQDPILHLSSCQEPGEGVSWGGW